MKKTIKTLFAAGLIMGMAVVPCFSSTLSTVKIGDVKVKVGPGVLIGIPDVKIEIDGDVKYKENRHMETSKRPVSVEKHEVPHVKKPVGDHHDGRPEHHKIKNFNEPGHHKPEVHRCSPHPKVPAGTKRPCR